VESAGFDTLLVADHYANAMAGTPLIVAAAAATTTLRVGSYVYSNDFRHPALLAKEIATADVLSGGRIEFGIGAGWLKEEYDQVGVRFDAPAVRADRFEEAVELIKEVLRGGTVTFAGHHYQLANYVAAPQPAQEKIPLLIGGGGPRVIRLAARRADIFGLAPRSLPQGGLDPADFAVSAVREKLATLDAAMSAEQRLDGGLRAKHTCLWHLRPRGRLSARRMDPAGLRRRLPTCFRRRARPRRGHSARTQGRVRDHLLRLL
jgi:probable F420-dependent oxidoreductase